ncbi:hypothetical protein AB4Y36_35365 [Paraburkholderia sp. BR10936]|uniref:hypothetical protein n=1 Tax=Paraburkholderia sp. BR10936 TaxID=3236993 RepID=UPI0034D25FDD
MKNMIDTDTMERRERIRKKAFEFAESGAFTNWQAIGVALRSQFSTSHVEDILASPFCRLDLNNRCDKARRHDLSDKDIHERDGKQGGIE